MLIKIKINDRTQTIKPSDDEEDGVTAIGLNIPMLSRDKIERTVDVVWVELATTSKFIAPPLSPHLMQRYSIEVRLYIRADMPLAG